MIVNCRYGDFSIPEGPDLIGDSLRLYGEWAQIEINTLAHFIGEGDVVVDAGAFIGTHARAFSKLVGSAGEVLAFEPNDVAFKFLEENVSQYTNIIAIPHALGSVEQKRFISSVANGNVGKAPLAIVAHDSQDRPVSVRPLDALGIERVNFIKADVEGMEQSILEGAANTINKSKPAIFVEVNTLEDSVPVIRWAPRADYLTFGIITPAFNLDNFNHVVDNVFGLAKETGLLLISRDGFAASVENIHRLNLPKIETVDDLALLLLHKPQYPYEVLDKSLAAEKLRITYPAPSFDAAQDLLQQRQATIGALHRQLSMMAEESEKAQELSQEQQTTINELKNTQAVMEHARQDACQLARKRQAEIDELTKMNAAVEHARQDAWQLAQERQVEIAELTKMRAAVELARQEAEELARERQETIDALYASTSWRSTALLRYLKRLCIRIFA